ncbi:hypothetical protein PSN45_004752 [Yamadazyma tenuis]|uniref:uncharacterized protein n=1 Tax=Candida tenuis TaxID=2315449 RepID=UPI0027A7F142|nr:hypothetical protein PSN45_004752 [Yamadazyma tenuis]
MSLFIDPDESDTDTPNKRQKLEEAVYEEFGDVEFYSDAESIDWEDVSLGEAEQIPQPDSFNISISNENPDIKVKNDKLKQILAEKKRKLSVHNLALNEKQFLSIIRSFKHNRDMAAQIFTGLLRCLGFEARLVFSIPVLSAKDKTLQPKLNRMKLDTNKDYDLLYPYFWTELVNPFNKSELFVLETCTFHDEEKRLTRVSRYSKDLRSYVPIFFPVKDQFNAMTMTYVISLGASNHILDVSARYMKNISYRWFKRLDLRTEAGRSYLLFSSIIRVLNNNTPLSDNSELKSLEYLGLHNYDIPQTRAAIKRSANFVTHASLRYDEVIDKDTKPIIRVKIDGKRVPVFLRNSVTVGKSEQQWKFLGRSILPDKVDDYIKTTRALLPRTISRKRVYNLNVLNNQPELNAVKLYSFSQTCSYIKPKVQFLKDQIILPKNKFGNIEVFKETMVPDGCTWLKLSNIESILNDKKNTDIQFVPVVTGFSFTKTGYAIPTKNGVIVLDNNVKKAKKFWLNFKINQHRNERKERGFASLRNWSDFITRMRIRSRLNRTYEYLD